MKHLSATLVDKCLEVTGISRVDFYKNAAFTIGTFILPKYMIQSFEVAPLEHLEDGSFNPSVFEYFRDVLTELYQGQPQEQVKVTRDFFGTQSRLPLLDRKMLAVEMYKLIFRFSIEKLTKFLAQDSFMVILMQYLADTKMELIH
jgi:hypothetical protein